MRRILLLAFGLLLLSCTKEQPVEPPKQVYLNDSNSDQTIRIPPGELLGNLELTFLMNSLQGDAILLINGPARAVGIDLTDAEDRSTVYFGEGYTGGGNTHLSTGTVIPTGRWLYCRAVVYRTLSGAVVAFLESIGEGFFDHLEDNWVEGVYEIEVWIDENGHVIRRVETSSDYQQLFRENRLKHERKGLIFSSEH